MFCASGCTTPTEDLGMVPDDGAQGGTSENTLTDGWTSGDGQTSGADLTSSDTSATGGELQTCGIVERACCSDQDRDSVPASMDNEPFIFNPDQADRDGDGLIDIADSCPTIGDGFVGDSDNDGLGNACDRCRQSPSQYNDVFEGASVAAFMLVRNIPTNADADHDGIGDACDNCPTVPNCGDFNEANPYVLGDAISYDDDTVCQTDSDGNGVGDACEGLMSGNAAGPAGLGPTDDHDQDGIANLNDACPRLPLLDTVACSDADPCPDGRQCSPEGTCNHVDSDGDGVGDRCDTCHAVANPNQIVEGESVQDDPDGDFIGRSCELGGECDQRAEPRATGFYEVSARGQCCVQLLVADEATGNLSSTQSCSDPNGCRPLMAALNGDADIWVPVREDCSGEQQDQAECLPLSPTVANTPGVLTPPTGCEQALAAAGITAVQNLQAPIIQDLKIADPYAFACLMPAADNDFDGFGTSCDLCPLDFDLSNAPYVDDDGRLWPKDGAACSGDFSCVED